MYGHIRKLAEAEKAGVEAAGGTVDFYQSVSPQRKLMIATPEQRSTPRC